MIEGGGLGVYHPADVGPVSFQAPNGVIDILVGGERKPRAPRRNTCRTFRARCFLEGAGSAPAAGAPSGKPAAGL